MSDLRDARRVDAIPDPSSIPPGVAQITLPFSMAGEDLLSGQDDALAAYAEALRTDQVELVLEVPLHQGNWTHLLSWMTRARTLGAGLSVQLSTSGPERSLSELDGDTLAVLHGIFKRWLQASPLHSNPERASQQADALLGRIRQWQGDAASRSPDLDQLERPGAGHSLLRRDEMLEPFLEQWLRLYDSPYVQQLLTEIAGGSSFIDEARRRRPLRLVALWQACVFQRADSLPTIRDIFGTPDNAVSTIAGDIDALAGTVWEGWLRGWADQLRLRALAHRERRFEVGGLRSRPLAQTASVTVVIPAYNHEAFVGEAIESVLAQSRADLRILVVDDGSTDRTVEEASRFDDLRVRVTRNAGNLGLGASLARALDEVDTEFVAILNSDDVFHPQRLERCLEQLTQCDVVSTGLTPIDATGRICSVADSSPVFDGTAIHNWLRWYEESGRALTPPVDLLGTLLERNFLITSSNLVARTDFLRHHRALWQALEFCLDWQLLLIAARHGTLRYLPETLLGYRLHERNTVWFDENRRWRYYLEVHQVVARTLDSLLSGREATGATRFAKVLEAVSESLARNTNVDWPGVVLGGVLNQLNLRPHQLDATDVARRLQKLDVAHTRQLEHDVRLHDLGVSFDDLFRMRGERPYLRAVRNKYEALVSEHEQLSREATTVRTELEGRLQQLTAERDAALSSPEWRVGDLLLSRLRLRRPALAAQRLLSAMKAKGTPTPPPAAERQKAPGERPTAVVAVTGRFPIYSHTFVYQELMGLRDMGLDVKLFYWIQEDLGRLHEAYAELGRNSVQLQSAYDEHRRDMEYCKRTFPGRLEALLGKIGACTGRTVAELESEYEIAQACTFARAVERYDPDYIHTYFFYEQSLFGMVAAWLLGIPRGITAYADHMLSDYPLKLVPLHLETADVIVATSNRIKRELVAIGGQEHGGKILVKPNGVDGRRFSFREPQATPGARFEVISVSRIEPKKGLLTLIDAARLLLDSGRDLRVHVVGTRDPLSPGSVEFAETFSRTLAATGVQSQFVLHGFKNQHEIVSLLRDAHAFVAPYVETTAGDKDGIPTALLEAMATGLPAVATDAGSILEVIDDGVEGVIVPQNDPARLAQAIQRLMDEPERRAAMGRAARARFERDFDCRVTEARLHDRIRQVLRRRNEAVSGA